LLFLGDFGVVVSRDLPVMLTIRFGCSPATQRGEAA